MKPIQKILCPVDFSEASVRALQWSEFLAQKFDAKLAVLHVMDFFPAVAELGLDYQQYQEEIASKLRTFVAPLKVPHETMLSTGDPARKITALVKAVSADLVVMGTHGMRGAAHKLVGSSTESVVRSVSVPVVTVAPGCASPGLAPVETVLVPLSLLSRAPRGYVRLRKIFRELKAAATLLHVVPLSDPMFGSQFGANPFLVTTYETAERKQRLLSMGRRILKEGAVLEPAIRFGDVADEVLKEVESGKYNYLLMSVKNKTVLSRFLESIAYRVISRSPVPVITVKTPAGK
jgi:nucleotide-binding universal stress UspA family protein